MEIQKPVKEGFLLFPPQGVLGQLKKSWHKKYCQLFKSSKQGIDRLEVFDTEEDVGRSNALRIITLENCIKITPEPQKMQQNVFTVVKRGATYHFSAVVEHEMAEWITALQTVAFKDDSSKQTIEEDNDLYCSSGEGVFTVNLVASDVSKRCSLDPGPYLLVISSAAIQLRDSLDNHVLFTWPYHYIRRYGYREGKFTFEAGRKCDSGEGTFHFEHSNQQEIFRCISSKMKSMRKLLHGEALPTPAIACGDSQFQAALSMEAGSRSPLPPSPTSATLLMDIDFSSAGRSQSSLKPLISSSSETRSLPFKIVPKPKPKAKFGGNALQRNFLSLGHSKYSQEDFSSDSSNSVEELGKYRKLSTADLLISSPTSDADDSFSVGYDRVEVKKDAWRTMGLDDTAHTEDYVSCEADEPPDYLSSKPVEPRQNSDGCDRVFPASKMIFAQVDPLDDYDKLQHFGLSSKLNSGSGYQHVTSPPVVTSPSLPGFPGTAPSEPTPGEPDSNEYDEIDNAIQSFRLANDSHQGYGMIRKKLGSAPLPDGPTHKLYYEQEYAVVHKPKKV
ncbi:uncharacterized protein LOC134535886 [Bacillus rossius redtenbacheri]|uniref:uncharacterized protein LOC134535886 n=1 Tax=Bacillus rossius redtenbacheri TaxID=93214 RepID=UPI002FDDDA07